jgi:phage terminase large subunit
LQAFKPKIFRGIDLMSLVGHITHEIDEWKPDAVFIDEGGMGAGVIDRLRQLNYTVTGVNFGSRALQDQHYSNKRMEIWDKCREWLEEGGCIPNDPELKADLVVPTYGFDPSNRMKLESKEDIKKRGCLSPDVAEGLVLTFSFPVTRREDVGRGNQALYKANTEYKLRR